MHIQGKWMYYVKKKRTLTLIIKEALKNPEVICAEVSYSDDTQALNLAEQRRHLAVIPS